MRLKMRTLIAICLFSFGSTFEAHAQTAFVKELNALEALGANTGLFEKIMSFEPFGRLPDPVAAVEIKETLRWLQDRGAFRNESSRFSYAYSAWLWKVGIKDTASAVYFLAALKSRSDGARCADKTAPASRIAQYEQLLAGPVTQFVQSQSKAKKEEIYRTATLRMEERLPLRQPDEWLCNGGMQFFQKYFEKHGDAKGREVQSSAGLPGRTIVLEDDAIKPEFIADDVWHVERRTAYEAALTNLKKFLLD